MFIDLTTLTCSCWGCGCPRSSISDHLQQSQKGSHEEDAMLHPQRRQRGQWKCFSRPQYDHPSVEHLCPKGRLYDRQTPKVDDHSNWDSTTVHSPHAGVLSIFKQIETFSLEKDKNIYVCTHHCIGIFSRDQIKSFVSLQQILSIKRRTRALGFALQELNDLSHSAFGHHFISIIMIIFTEREANEQWNWKTYRRSGWHSPEGSGFEGCFV